MNGQRHRCIITQCKFVHNKYVHNARQLDIFLSPAAFDLIAQITMTWTNENINRHNTLQMHAYLQLEITQIEIKQNLLNEAFYLPAVVV